MSKKIEILMKPLISIIIPVYGAEKYLNECLLSVRNQTLQDIEIICVNDCSPDNSMDIIKANMEEDNRIILINHDVNKHEGGARNTGIENATADWLYFVDNDDALESNCCEMLYNATLRDDSSNIDLICCNSNNYIEEFGRNFIIWNGMPKNLEAFDNRSISLEDINYKIDGYLPMPPWTKLHRKSFILDNNISFLEHITCSDWGFALTEYFYVRNIFVMNKKLYNYKQIRKGNQTSSLESFDPFIFTYEKQIQVLLNNNSIDLQLRYEILQAMFNLFMYTIYRLKTCNIRLELKRIHEILKKHEELFSVDESKIPQLIEEIRKGNYNYFIYSKKYLVSRILNKYNRLWNYFYIIKSYMRKL